MAMSVGPGGGEDLPMSDINTTPLVDVMLVLLIIFLIAIPVAIKTVKVRLPSIVFEPTVTKPENVSLSVNLQSDGTCGVFWNQTRMHGKELLDRAVAKLKADIDKAGGIQNIKMDDLPEVHLRGDIDTPYRCIGGAIFTMQLAGFPKVGFISRPNPEDLVITR